MQSVIICDEHLYTVLQCERFPDICALFSIDRVGSPIVERPLKRNAWSGVNFEYQLLVTLFVFKE